MSEGWGNVQTTTGQTSFCPSDLRPDRENVGHLLTIWEVVFCRIPMPSAGYKMNAAQLLFQSCSRPRSKVWKVNADYRTAWQSYKGHTPNTIITPTWRVVEVFVEMCKKINLKESQDICSLMSFSSQYSCLYQFFFLYIFWKKLL